MKRQMTVGYQNRQGARGDLPTAQKITLANHLIKKLSGFSVGDKVTVEYLQGSIIINKTNSNLCQKQ